MLCQPAACGCSFFSSTLNISIDSNGLVTIEQAEFTDIAEMQADIAALEAIVADMQGDLSSAGTDLATLITSVDRLDQLVGGSASANSGTTSGTTALTVATATLPTLAYAGQLFGWCAIAYSKTVSSDVFGVSARINGATAATGGADRAGAAAGWSTANAGPISVSAGTAPTVDTQLTRASGTGTATVTSAVVRWLFVPT